MEALILTELQVLIAEAKKKSPQLKEASEAAINVLKGLPDHGADLVDELSRRDEVLKAFLLACDPKNLKTTLIAVNCIQKLTSQRAIPQNSIAPLLTSLKEVVETNVDVQLKILQIILHLLSNFEKIHEDLLGEAFGICFKLCNNKNLVVSSTASATIRQILGSVFERASKDKSEPKGKEKEKEGLSFSPSKRIALTKLNDSQRDAFLLLQDICFLTNGEPTEWLKVTSISRSLGFDLIESIFEHHSDMFIEWPEFTRVLKDRVCPLLIKTFSDKTSFPTSVRLMRVVTSLIEKLNSIMSMECEIFLTMLTKTAEGDFPPWVKVLSLEALRKLCCFPTLLRKLYVTYDQQENSTKVIHDIVLAFAHTVTQVGPGRERTSFSYIPTKNQLMDQLDKTEPPVIPENHLPSLGLTGIFMVSKGLGSFVLPNYPRISLMEPSESTTPFNSFKNEAKSPIDEKLSKDLKGIVDATWKSISSAISFAFFFSTNNEELAYLILETYLIMIPLCDALEHSIPRDVMISSVCEHCLPPRDDPKVLEQGASSLNEKHFGAFQVLLKIIQSLGCDFETTWVIILEAFQNLDRVIRTSPVVSVKSPTREKNSSPTSSAGLVRTFSQDENISFVLNSIDKLFVDITHLPETSFKNFIIALGALLDESLDSNSKQTPFRAKNATQSERKPFAIDKIQKIVFNNSHRILSQNDSSIWDLIVDHLCKAAAGKDSIIRVHASETLTEMIKTALELQDIPQLEKSEELQLKFLKPLKNLMVKSPPEIQERQLVTLYQILQNSGHSFTKTWDFIFEILQIAASVHVNENTPNNSLIRAAFQPLQLICTDFLSYLSFPGLHRCISTLGLFAAQNDDLNISLNTVSLIWSVADFARQKRVQLLEKLEKAESSTKETIDTIDSLWLALLSEVGQITNDARPEVRNGAIQTLFRIISLNGSHLKSTTWHACLWKIIFPLLDGVKVGVMKPNDQGTKKDKTPIVVHHSRNTAEKQWDETRILAFSCVSRVFHEYFYVLMGLEGFKRAWILLLEFFEEFTLNCGESVVIVATESMKEVLEFPKKNLGEDRIEEVREYWYDAWLIWEKVGHSASKVNGFTQDMFLNYIKTFDNILKVLNPNFSSREIKKILQVLKGFLTYPYADTDYVRDNNNLTRLQALIFEQFELFDLSNQANRSIIIVELVEFMNVSFQKGNSQNHDPNTPKKKNGSGNSFAFFSVAAMDKLVDIFTSYVHDETLYLDEVFDKIIMGFGISMNLKYKSVISVSKQQPLWKVATKSFLLIIKSGIQSANTLKNLSPEILKSTWKKVLDVFAGYLLIQAPPISEEYPLEQLQEDEKFDVSVITSLRHEILPLMNGVPVELVFELLDLLQKASEINSEIGTLPHGNKHKHFSREHFACACLGSIFSLCASTMEFRNFSEKSKQEIAAVAAKIALDRSHTIIKTYLQAKSHSEQLHYRKVSNEELLYVLHEILQLDIKEGALVPNNLRDPAKAMMKSVKNIHLLMFYNDLVKLLSCEDKEVIKICQQILLRFGNEIGIDSLDVV